MNRLIIWNCSVNTIKQVHSDNDASEVDILGHLGASWDILGHFGILFDEFGVCFPMHFRPFSHLVWKKKNALRTDGQNLLYRCVEASKKSPSPVKIWRGKRERICELREFSREFQIGDMHHSSDPNIRSNNPSGLMVPRVPLEMEVAQK